MCVGFRSGLRPNSRPITAFMEKLNKYIFYVLDFYFLSKEQIKTNGC